MIVFLSCDLCTLVGVDFTALSVFFLMPKFEFIHCDHVGFCFYSSFHVGNHLYQL